MNLDNENTLNASTNILFPFFLSICSEPLSFSKFESTGEEMMMMSGNNKRTYSTSSNSSVVSNSFCVTLGVGPLWCS
jgi:hypothetical protein